MGCDPGRCADGFGVQAWVARVGERPGVQAGQKVTPFGN